jgi:hypothetical protein
MRTDGIGPLPLLFVNKQIYKEVSSLVYSMLESVSIGGYLIQRPDEDPNVRWSVAYTLLRNQPSLLKYTKKVNIFMPTVSQSRSLSKSSSLQERYFSSCYIPKEVSTKFSIFV